MGVKTDVTTTYPPAICDHYHNYSPSRNSKIMKSKPHLKSETVQFDEARSTEYRDGLKA
jgi:hypothetical protein